jgi:hypothetical protein
VRFRRVKRVKNGVAVKFESGVTSSHSSDVPKVADSHVGELLRRKSEKASGEGLL